MESKTISDSTPSTIKEFLEDSYKFTLEKATLIKIEDYPKESNSFALIFDKTIFHPQGGGQPSDEGEIISISNNIVLTIEGVGYDRERDLVLHKISKEKFNSTGLSVGDKFNMKINEQNRTHFAKLHSGGHLLDTSISKLGLNLVPGKGYHFPDGSYVEYSGNIDKNQIPKLIQDMEKVTNEIIETSSEENSSISKLYEYEEGKKIFGDIPNYLPSGKPFRWVKLLDNDVGCPCGGTHVKHIKEIKGLKINKITNKGKVVRISYSVID